MSFRRVVKDIVFFDQQATRATSSVKFNVSDFRNCVIEVLGTASFNGSIFIAAALGETAPTFVWGSNTHDNPFTFLQAINLDNGASVNGSTGIEIRGTSLLQMFEVNVNAVDWITVILTGSLAGAVTVKATVTTNL